MIRFEEECLQAEQERTAQELEDKRLAEEQALKIIQDQDTEMTEQEPTPESDKGKSSIQDKTPPESPIITQREFGTSSSGITPELREILDMHHAEIVPLKESN
jgi:hypothetical protein